MRIVVFSSYFYPHKGGVERYVQEIYRRLVKEGIGVDIITCNTNNSPMEEMIDGMQIYHLDCWHLLGGTFPVPKINKRLFDVLQALNKNPLSFVNTQTRFFVLSFIGFLYGKIKGIKVIHTEHGTQHSVLSNPVTNLLSKVYDHTIGYLVTKYAGYNVAISDASGQFSRHLGAARYDIVYNGIDTNKFRRRNTGIKSRMKIDPQHKIITFVGRLIEAKGVQDLINAFEEIKRDYKVKLLVVGSGNYLQELRKMSVDNPDIIFTGEKSEEEIIELLSITDIFVNPSYSEGLPTSVLEAASCGCPIIASDVGGTKEIIQHGRNGLLFNSKNTGQLSSMIRSLLDNSQARLQYGAHAMETVESKYDWDMIASQYIVFLKKQV